MRNGLSVSAALRASAPAGIRAGALAARRAGAPGAILAAGLAILLAGAPTTLPAQPAGFSAERAAGHLRILSREIGPRPMGSPAERDALAYAVHTLLENGCDTAFVMPMLSADGVITTSGIAVGIKQGGSGRTIVLGGHIDSAGPEIPGANDDASGSAIVLEAARVLNAKPRTSTYLYALFGGEEQGLRGSKYFVANWSGIDSVDLMLQFDMANADRVLLVDPHSHPADAPPWLMRAAVEEISRAGSLDFSYPAHYFSLNYALPFGSGSDHIPFLEAGIPAIDFTTDVGDPIHTPQDSYENFNLSGRGGLAGVGALAVALAERFDTGIPERTVGSWFYYLAGDVLIAIPTAAIWGIIALSVILAVTALVRLRAPFLVLRADPEYRPRRWPLLKMTVIAASVALAGWYSTDIVGLITGTRFPWFSPLGWYYLLGMLTAAAALLLMLKFSGRGRFTPSPYLLYKRAIILLFIFQLMSIGDLRLGLGPALAMAMVSAAALIPFAPAKLVLIAVSPAWILRLIFSEADTLMFRFTSTQLAVAGGPLFALNATLGLLIALIILPALLAAAGALRQSPVIARLTARAADGRLLAFACSLCGLLVLYLALNPAYAHPYYPTIRIEESLGPDSASLSVMSSEYMAGAVVSGPGFDTTLEGGSSFDRTLDGVSAPAHAPGGAEPWSTVERAVTVSEGGRHDVMTRISSALRPFTVRVEIGTGDKVDSPHPFKQDDTSTTISWYSFPDTPVVAMYGFTVDPGDTVEETVTVTFDTLAVPVSVRSSPAMFVRRTIVTDRRRYAGPPADTSSRPDTSGVAPGAKD